MPAKRQAHGVALPGRLIFARASAPRASRQEPGSFSLGAGAFHVECASGLSGLSGTDGIVVVVDVVAVGVDVAVVVHVGSVVGVVARRSQPPVAPRTAWSLGITPGLSRAKTASCRC